MWLGSKCAKIYKRQKINWILKVRFENTVHTVHLVFKSCLNLAEKNITFCIILFPRLALYLLFSLLRTQFSLSQLSQKNILVIETHLTIDILFSRTGTRMIKNKCKPSFSSNWFQVYIKTSIVSIVTFWKKNVSNIK